MTWVYLTSPSLLGARMVQVAARMMAVVARMVQVVARVARSRGRCRCSSRWRCPDLMWSSKGPGSSQ